MLRIIEINNYTTTSAELADVSGIDHCDIKSIVRKLKEDHERHFSLSDDFYFNMTDTGARLVLVHLKREDVNFEKFDNILRFLDIKKIVNYTKRLEKINGKFSKACILMFNALEDLNELPLPPNDDLAKIRASLTKSIEKLTKSEAEPNA